MPRRVRSNKLQVRSNRLQLKKGRVHSVQIAPSLHLVYRPSLLSSGSWSIESKRKPEWLRKIGSADDYEAANGETVLDYAQAVEKGLALGRSGEGNSGGMATVFEAVEAMEADLKVNGGAVYNASTLKKRHLPAMLANRPVGLLKKKDLTDWWAVMLAKGLTPESVKRIAKSLASALNDAADEDSRIKNRNVWKQALRPRKPTADEKAKAEALRDNFILPDASVTALVRGAYDNGRAEGDDLGLLFDLMAESGVRESQLFALRVEHLHDDDPAAPYLDMPTSRKGSTRKKERQIETRPLPISQRLAKALRQQAIGRAPNDLLFSRIWNLNRRFQSIAKKLGLHASLSPYVFRYSAIARQLLQGLPLRVVAVNVDTSTTMIEKFYTRHIAKAKKTDELTRAALLDHDPTQPADNVVVTFRRAAE